MGRPPPLPRELFVSESGKDFHFRCIEDDHGGYYIFWTHADQEDSYSLLAQHGKAQTAKEWPEPGLLIGVGIPDAKDWDAFSDGKSGVIITWEEKGHIHAQRYLGHKHLWAEDSVTTSSLPQHAPAGVGDGSGGAYLVWSEKRYPDRSVLMVQHLSAQGASLWGPEGIRVSLRPSAQYRPGIVPDGNLGAIVGWSDWRDQSSQIQSQRMDFQGNRLWGSEGTLVTSPAGAPRQPPIMAGIGGGSAVLAWAGSESGSTVIKLQSVDPTGKLLWVPQGLELTTGRWDEWNPVIYSNGQGGVSWVGSEDYRNHTKWQVFVQAFDVNGEPLLQESGAALGPGSGDQGQMALADNGDEGVLAAWIDNRFGSPGVFIQDVDSEGLLLWGKEGKQVADNLENPARPQILRLAPQQATVFWSDQTEKGSWSLYSTTVSYPNQPPPPSPSTVK